MTLVCHTKEKKPNRSNTIECSTNRSKVVPHKSNPTSTKLYRKNRKRVRFEEKRNEIIARDPRSICLDASWYNQMEYQSFQMDARRNVMAFVKMSSDSNNLLDPSEYSLRGLEKHQHPAARAYSKAQNRQFIRLIIGEHFRLRELGIADSELERQLQNISSMYTVPAKVYAMQLARYSV